MGSTHKTTVAWVQGTIFFFVLLILGGTGLKMISFDEFNRLDREKEELQGTIPILLQDSYHFLLTRGHLNIQAKRGIDQLKAKYDQMNLLWQKQKDEGAAEEDIVKTEEEIYMLEKEIKSSVEQTVEDYITVQPRHEWPDSIRRYEFGVDRIADIDDSGWYYSKTGRSVLKLLKGLSWTMMVAGIIGLIVCGIALIPLITDME